MWRILSRLQKCLTLTISILFSVPMFLFGTIITVFMWNNLFDKINIKKEMFNFISLSYITALLIFFMVQLLES